MALSTAFTELFRVRHPIALAPMGGSAGGALAAAVCRGGGLGMLGSGDGDPQWLAREVPILASRTDRPWGIGFLTWAIGQRAVERAMRYGPHAIMLSFGDPSPFTDLVRESGAALIIQVTDLDEARRAVDLGADVIVAQGTEAGGHGARHGRSTLPFVPIVVDLAGPVPVLAAGGIADGRGIAAALALGAAGALIGTRFQATAESLADPAIVEAILGGRGQDTERSTLLDIVRGSRWPPAYTARTLGHPHLDRWRGHEAEATTDPQAQRDYQDDLARGAIPPLPVWAGEAIDLINDLPSAADLVTTLAARAENALALITPSSRQQLLTRSPEATYVAGVDDVVSAELERQINDIAGDGGLVGLRRLSEAITEIEARRTRIINQLRREHRASWDEIGQACGMTRQGATRRWSRKLHAASFGSAVEAYQRGRPPYPSSAVEWAVPRNARRVLDLGAGTGKFTQLLVDARLDVVAVEPSPQMRDQLAAAVPRAAVYEGSAERIPLPDSSVDAVVVAQAWHWVDPDLAIPEVARVLRPGGTLSLIWNIRDHTEPWVALLDNILDQHTRQEMDTRPALGAPFEQVEHTEIRWRHSLGRSELLDLVASRSYVIVLPEEQRRELLGSVEELLDSHPDLRQREEISLPYVTQCTRARRGAIA
jgi:nitronate monooxygenase